MTGYELTLAFIQAVNDLQIALDNKQSNKDIFKESILEQKVNNAEENMMKIKRQLKAINT